MPLNWFGRPKPELPETSVMPDETAGAAGAMSPAPGLDRLAFASAAAARAAAQAQSVAEAAVADPGAPGTAHVDATGGHAAGPGGQRHRLAGDGPYLDFGSRTPNTAPDRRAGTPEVIRLRADLRRALDRITVLEDQLRQLQHVNERTYAADYDTTGGPGFDPGQPFGTLPARRLGRAINLTKKGAL